MKKIVALFCLCFLVGCDNETHKNSAKKFKDDFCPSKVINVQIVEFSYGEGGHTPTLTVTVENKNGQRIILYQDPNDSIIPKVDEWYDVKVVDKSFLNHLVFKLKFNHYLVLDKRAD